MKPMTYQVPAQKSEMEPMTYRVPTQKPSKAKILCLTTVPSGHNEIKRQYHYIMTEILYVGHKKTE